MDITFAEIVAVARRHLDMTADEFDYALATEQTRAHAALGEAVRILANRGRPEVQPGDGPEVLRARDERADDLMRRVRPDIDRMVAEAKSKSYTGWSAASRGPIRYTQD